MKSNDQYAIKWRWPRNLFCGLRVNIALSTTVLLLAFWMSARLQLIPCHLCILQRILYGAMIIVSIFSFLWNYRSHRKPILAYSTNLFLAICGFLIALRQSYLKWYPSLESSACLPDFSTLFTLFPPLEALTAVLNGSSDCSQVDWTFLGLSLAEYSMILFLILASINFYFLFIKKSTFLTKVCRL